MNGEYCCNQTEKKKLNKKFKESIVWAFLCILFDNIFIKIKQNKKEIKSIISSIKMLFLYLDSISSPTLFNISLLSHHFTVIKVRYN